MRGRTVGAVAAVLGLAAVGGAFWLLSGGPEVSPRVRDADSPARERAPAAAESVEAAPVAAAPVEEGPRGGVAVLGRLVRGTPRVPVVGEVSVTAPGRPARTAKAGADGRFLVDGLPPGGRVDLVATSEGLLPARHGGVLLDRRGALDLGDVVLGEGSPVQVLAVDRADRPVAGATVKIRRSTVWRASTDWTAWVLGDRPKPTDEATATTGLDGTAVLPRVPPGGWSVVVEAKGYGAETGSVTVEEGREIGRVRVVLLPAHALRGTVRHHDGKPAAGAVVIANALTANWFADAGRIEAVADALGAYAMEGLRQGEIQVAVRPSADVQNSVGTVQVPEVAVYDIRLQEGITVRGKVSDDASGAPLAGARVSVSLWGGTGGDMGSQGRGSTGEDGAYEVRGLQPGNFGGIQARLEGYLDFPDGRARGAMASEQVGPGIVLERDARLRKGAAVAGRVADAKGTPVAGARVTATAFAQNRGMDVSPPSLTAEDGTYRIENLAAGPVLLKVHAEGCAQADYPANEWQALQQGPAPEACTATVPDSGEVRKDLVIVRGGAVTGSVSDRDGKPAPGLQVTVSSSKNSVGGGTGTTDAEGKFRLEGVAPGDGLKVSAWGPKSVHGTSDEFSLGESGSVEGIRVTVTPGATIAGRVSRADGGSMADGTLRLVQGVLDTDQPWDWDWQRRSATAQPMAADGTFRIDGLMAGKYTLIAAAPGAAETLSPGIEIAAGETKEGVEVVVSEEKAIAGRVITEAGEPVAGARISAERVRSRQVFWGPGHTGPVVAITGPGGEFTVAGTGEGEYKISAAAPGLSTETVQAKGGARDVTITMKAGGSIAGLVVDEATGEPVADLLAQAQPTVQSPTGPQGTTSKTGKDGSFLLRDLKPGNWNVIAGATWGSEGEHVPKTVASVKVGTQDLRIAVARGLAISGSVVDGEGKPVTGQLGVNAQGVDADGKPDHSRQRWTQTEGGGTFRLGGLKPGAYDVHVQHWGGPGGEGFAPAVRKGVAAGTEGVVVTVTRGAPITGRVVDEEGRPWSKSGWISVTVSGETTGSQVSWGQVQPDGSFSTQALDAGKTYDLSVQGGQGGLLVHARGIAGGSKDVVLRATKGLSISGRVTDEEGGPVKGVYVRARAEGVSPNSPGAQSGASTAEDGTFTISGLVDAKYRLVAGGMNSDWMPSPKSEPLAAGSEGIALKVRKGVALSGKLVDASGNPVKPQAFGVVPEGGSDEDTSWGSVAEDGTFTVKGLAPGRVRVRAWLGDGWKECGTFDAPATGVVATVP